MGWVSLLPPCHEHLVRDLGATNSALAVVLCAAVATMERRLALTALVAYLAASVPHPVVPAQHLEPLSAANCAGLLALLGGRCCTAALLWPSGRWAGVRMAEARGRSSRGGMSGLPRQAEQPPGGTTSGRSGGTA